MLVVHHENNIYTCSRWISFTRLVIILWCRKKVSAVMFCKQFLLMLCTLIGAIILSINIQVGLNMHLLMTSGDASSSLRGSTSSLYGQWSIVAFNIIYSIFYYPILIANVGFVGNYLMKNINWVISRSSWRSGFIYIFIWSIFITIYYI